MARFALAALLPVLLLAATRGATKCLFPPPSAEVEVLASDDAALRAEGPIVYANTSSEARIWRGALLVSHRDLLVALPAFLPRGAAVRGLRLADLDRDGRCEIFLTLEYAADTAAPRRVVEVGYAFFPDPGAVEVGEIQRFLTFARLVDRKSDSAPNERIASYTPDDAPAGRFPDLVAIRTAIDYRPGGPFTPGGVVRQKTDPPIRLAFDPATRTYAP